jgi:hypothetical protein
MPTQTKRTALDAFMGYQLDALALIERIHEGIESNDLVPAPEQINWGHAGDMNEIRRMLQEISDRLFIEGEYAPEAN